MSIQFGDILQHNNLLYPIVDVNDIKGGLRSIATFSSPALATEFASIPEKPKTGYSLLLETSTGTIYYLAGTDATNKFHWSPVGVGGNGYGVTNTIPKWTSSSVLGNSNITDNGDTVVINANLQVIGTTSTISTENLLVKDPIILLAGSQSGTPTYDAGLFVNRGSSDTQAFIWDESMGEFKFITTTSGATVSGDVIIGTYSTVRTGILRIGTQSIDSNDRFVVSSSGGTISLVVDENGYVYNRGRGNISTNTAFGLMTLGSNTSGNRNTAFGASALSVNTTGSYNTAIGQQALMSNLGGSYNTAIGHQALNQNTSGQYNIAIGINSLRNSKTIQYNIAIGGNSMFNTISNSFYNIAIGYQTLYNNTIGGYNTAVGYNALYNTTTTINTFSITNPGTGYVPGTYTNVQLIYATGSTAISYPKVTIVVDGSGVVTSVVVGTNPGSGFQDSTTRMTISNAFLGGTGSDFEVGVGSLLTGNFNTALGFQALYGNTTGTFNVGLGYSVLSSNTTGAENIGIGYSSLGSNTTGSYNVSIGKMAMLYNTTGSNNTAVGWQALPRNTTGYSNMGIGRNSMFYSKTGVENTAVGDAALYYNTLGSSNTALGSAAGFSNTTGVATIGTFSGGNGYTPGTYSGVQLKYYSGTSLDGVLVDYPKATIVIGTGGTVSSVTLENTGKTFQNTSTIMTSTASVIGPGTGFTIQINSIQTAQYNTTIGNNSLYFNTIGSNNTSLGYQAGSYTSVGNNDISDNSIFIGFQSRAQYSNQTNQIVIGYDAYGNGSNTVTLGNDSIIKTYLKGNVQLPTIPTTSTGTYSILTRNDITGEVEKIVVAPYKVYTALLTQSGTSAPTAIVLENTLGVSVTFGYTIAGQYSVTATGALTINKTWIIFNNIDSNGFTITYNGKSLNDFQILTRNGGLTTDNILNLTEIEIRVYN